MFKKVIFSALALLSVSFAHAEPQVLIGAALPLTGDLNFVGEDIRRGMELALPEVNTGSVKFKVIYEDTRLQAKDAVNAARKLVDVDKVNILIGLWDMCDPVAPIAEQKQIPNLCIRWNPHIAEKFAYTATFETTYINYAKAQVELLKALKIKTVSLATEESQGWIMTSGKFAELAKQAGIEVLVEEQYQPTTPDYRSIATKLLSKHPDMVVSSGYQPGIDLLIKKIREQRPDQKITGYFEAFQPPSFIEGLPFVAQNDVSPEFRKLFRDKYGEDFKARAAHGYDLVKIIASIYIDGKQLTGKEVVDGFSKVKNFSGVTGVLSANSTKNIENEPVWMVVKDGKMVRFKP